MTEPTSELAAMLADAEAENQTGYAEILDKHQEAIDAHRAAEDSSSVPIPADKRVV